MGRPLLAIGELGSVAWRDVAGGVEGRARTRSASGQLERISATAPTRELVLELLIKQASVRGLRVAPIAASMTLGELLGAWLLSREGEIRDQSVQMYSASVARLVSVAGGIAVADFDAGVADATVQAVKERWSPAAARHALTVLRGALDLAQRRGAITSSPMGAVRGVKASPSPLTWLTPAQVTAVRAALLGREVESRIGQGRPVSPVYRLAVDIALVGLRIGEVLGLRRGDYDRVAGTLAITGTLIGGRGKSDPPRRQDELKSRAQARRLLLPEYAIAACEEALTLPSTSGPADLGRLRPDAPLLQSAAGGWVSPRNLANRLKVSVDTPAVAAALAETGLTPADITPHLLRRTAATALALADGDLRRASATLGHSDQRVTRAAYAGLGWVAVADSRDLHSLLIPTSARVEREAEAR